MPVVTAASSITFIAAALWTFASWFVVFATGSAADPGGTLPAVLGAGPGALIALLEARAKGRNLADTVRVFLGSGSLGMFGPGVALWAIRTFTQWLPDTALPLPWEVTAAAGFAFAMSGWPLLLKLNRWFEARTDAVLHLASKRYNVEAPFDDPGETPRRRRD